jgi:hypothetical protein
MKSLLEMELTDSPEFPYSMRKVFEKRASSRKVAGFLETVERIAPKALVAGATAGLAGLATEAVVRGGEGLINAVQKARAFKRVIAQNPDFQELDAHQVREQFDTIYQFSPSAAKSPMVAGSWMRMLNSQQLEGHQLIPTETVRDLVSIQQSISSTHPSMGKEVAKSLAAGMLKDTGGSRRGGGGTRGIGAAVSKAFAFGRKKELAMAKRLSAAKNPEEYKAILKKLR